MLIPLLLHAARVALLVFTHLPIHRVITGIYSVRQLKPHKQTHFINHIVDIDSLVHALAGHNVHSAHGAVGSTTDPLVGQLLEQLITIILVVVLGQRRHLAAVPHVPLQDVEDLDEALRGYAVHGLEALELGRLVAEIGGLVLRDQNLRRDFAVIVLSKLFQVYLKQTKKVYI